MPLDAAVRHGVRPTIEAHAGACSNIWHLDELCLMLNGERGWLWRAVEDAGEVLDILVQLGLIRFRGHFPKGGYDVHDGNNDPG